MMPINNVGNRLPSDASTILMNAAERGIAVWHRTAAAPQGPEANWEYTQRFANDLARLEGLGLRTGGTMLFSALGEPGLGALKRRPTWRALLKAIHDERVGLLITGAAHELTRDVEEYAMLLNLLVRQGTSLLQGDQLITPDEIRDAHKMLADHLVSALH